MGLQRWTGARTTLCMTLLLSAAAGAGPLRVHPTNPRYFTDGTKNADGEWKAVYLTGSHTWHNLQDGGPTDPPAAFDYQGFLDFLVEQNHNFFRLWAWESPREAAWHKGTLYCEPLPYLRTGPGNGVDGKPCFDVTKFNPEYFERLRERVQAARERGLYVGVMLFQGFSVAKKAKRAQNNPWPGHPFHRDNNINGIDGDTNSDGNGYETHTLDNPRVTALQEAYVRRVIDTVGPFDNVVYEISNESHGRSTAWQYHMIELIRQYEKTRGWQHPVWMSFQWDDTDGAGTNQALFDSPAEVISPRHGTDAREAYRTDPPVADGAKVILLDTDHLWGEGGDAAWVWKSFLRGHQPIYMDRLAKLTGDKRGDIPGAEGVRLAMGMTRRLARRVSLAALTPHPELASTGYCLADPGHEYIVYLPQGGEVTVDLTAASDTLAVEWLNPRSGEIVPGPSAARGTKLSFRAPFAHDAVLCLRAQSHP